MLKDKLNLKLRHFVKKGHLSDLRFDVVRCFEDRADRALHSWAYWQFKYSHDRFLSEVLRDDP